MSIITKTGDDGTTGLLRGERVLKSNPRMQLIGTLDELNAQLGVLRSLGADAFLGSQLAARQNELFELGARLADLSQTTDDEISVSQADNPSPLTLALKKLEKHAHALESELPPLTAFILPGGHPLAARAHLARTLARRAERQLVALQSAPSQHSTPKITASPRQNPSPNSGPNPTTTRAPNTPHGALPYLNRLSDYLFLVARRLNQKLQTPEVEWS